MSKFASAKVNPREIARINLPKINLKRVNSKMPLFKKSQKPPQKFHRKEQT